MSELRVCRNYRPTQSGKLFPLLQSFWQKERESLLLILTNDYASRKSLANNLMDLSVSTKTESEPRMVCKLAELELVFPSAARLSDDPQASADWRRATFEEKSSPQSCCISMRSIMTSTDNGQQRLASSSWLDEACRYCYYVLFYNWSIVCFHLARQEQH